MNPKYRFFLRIGSATATAHAINPIWKDDLAIEYARESGQWFHRANLSGSVDLIRDDYTYVTSQSFGTVFYFDVEISDNGASWSLYWRGKFTLTDCKVNVDDKCLTVKPQVVDQYTDILAGLEKEYDLIKLKPEMEAIFVSRRPCIQVYESNSETLTNVYGNISFEQEASLPLDYGLDYLVRTCHFAVLSNYMELRFTEVDPDYATDFADPFTGNVLHDGDTMTNAEGTFYILFEATMAMLEKIISLRIIRMSDDATMWEWSDRISLQEDISFPKEIHFTATGSEQDMVAESYDYGVFSRVICNVDTYDGNDTFRITNDDIAPSNRNYTRVFPYNVNSFVAQSSNVTSTPTKWGRRESDGMYYLPPDESNPYVPLGRNKWGSTSVWLMLSNDLLDLDLDATYHFLLNDAYPLWSCIAVLLAEIAPGITFDGTTAYSDFLYSGLDPVGSRDNALYLTPKSNIIVGEYETPAMTAPLTLKSILEMLRNVYQCYWYVDSSNRLRIEHVQYFMNGGTYSGVPSVGVDITSLVNPRNNKAWSFGVNTFEFEKVEMPERYQFAWMDEVTDIFKGNAIEMVSDYVEKGKIEEISVNKFTSDIDYLMLNPSGVSKDGFALLNAIYDSYLGGYAVPIFSIVYDVYTVRLQNGYLSYFNLQDLYWRQNMPCRYFKINGNTIDAKTSGGASISRNKKQTVTIPVGMTDPDTLELVRTGLGDGQIHQMSVSLISRMAKTQLRYDTE